MSKTEGLHAAGFIISEASGNLSRDNGTLISGQNLLAGMVLGKITVAGATSAAKSGGNTGGGTCTMDGTTPVLAGAKAGIYTARCKNLVANSGVFEIRDPSGNVVGLATGGVAFDKEIKMVIADSGTDFAIGDGFDITVAAGSLKLTRQSITALDGSQAAVGILLADCDASAADKACAIVSRQAEVNSNEITWPTSITDAQKAVAVAAFAAVGLVIR